MAAKISREDRELTRVILSSRAEELKRKHPHMTLHQVRQHLHEMITVSI